MTYYHTLRTRVASLLLVGWIVGIFSIHTRTPLFTRSSLVYFRNLGEKDMRYLGDVGRRGGVGREATLDPVLVSPEMDTPR